VVECEQERVGPLGGDETIGGSYRFRPLRNVIPYSCAMLIEEERLQDLFVGVEGVDDKRQETALVKKCSSPP
jgi:hypothetical protein